MIGLRHALARKPSSSRGALLRTSTPLLRDLRINSSRHRGSLIVLARRRSGVFWRSGWFTTASVIKQVRFGPLFAAQSCGVHGGCCKEVVSLLISRARVIQTQFANRLLRENFLVQTSFASVPGSTEQLPTELPLIGWWRHPGTCRLTQPHMSAQKLMMSAQRRWGETTSFQPRRHG